jgi:hypothetical protein
MDHPTLDSNIISAFIGAGVSLLVLLLTLFWDRKKASTEKKESRQKKLIYCAALIKPIISYSEKQILNIQAFAESLKANPLEFPLLTFAPKSDIDKFVNRVDEESFFDAFTTFYKPYAQSVKTFKGITSAINYENLQMEQVIEMVKTSQALDYERKIKFKNSLKAATDLAAGAIADQSMHQFPALLALLDKSLVDYLGNRDSPSDLKYAYTAFVDPVIKGIVEKQFYHIPVGAQIAGHLHDASEVYHDIIMQMQSLQEDFTVIAENYAKVNDTLKKEAVQLSQDFFDNTK